MYLGLLVIDDARKNILGVQKLEMMLVWLLDLELFVSRQNEWHHSLDDWTEMEIKLCRHILDEKFCNFNINNQQNISKLEIGLEIQDVCGVTGKKRVVVIVILVNYMLQLW